LSGNFLAAGIMRHGSLTATPASTPQGAILSPLLANVALSVLDRRRTRVRYLRALEEERFEQLPAGAYRRTFLRGYANFLGLDADAFVDEYAARFERLEGAERVALPVPARVRRLPGARHSRQRPCSRSRWPPG
jgi:hypothetical protein